jgi:hypothetical protein
MNASVSNLLMGSSRHGKGAGGLYRIIDVPRWRMLQSVMLERAGGLCQHLGSATATA